MNSQDATTMPGLGSQFQTATPRTLGGYGNALGSLNAAQKLQLQQRLRNLDLMRQQQQQQQQVLPQQQQPQSQGLLASQASQLYQQQLQQQQARASSAALQNGLSNGLGNGLSSGMVNGLGVQSQVRPGQGTHLSQDQLFSQRLQQQALAASLARGHSSPNQFSRLQNGAATANVGNTANGYQMENLVRLLNAQQQSRAAGTTQPTANMQSILMQARQQPSTQTLNPQLLQTLDSARSNPMLNSALRNNLNTLNRSTLLAQQPQPGLVQSQAQAQAQAQAQMQAQSQAQIPARQAQLQQVLAAVQAKCSQFGGRGSGPLLGKGGQSPQEVLVHLGVCFARLQISIEAAIKADLLGNLAPKDIRVLAEAHALETQRIRNGGVGQNPQDLVPNSGTPTGISAAAANGNALNGVSNGMNLIPNLAQLANNAPLQQQQPMGVDRNIMNSLTHAPNSIAVTLAQLQQQQQLAKLGGNSTAMLATNNSMLQVSAPQFDANKPVSSPVGNSLFDPMGKEVLEMKAEEQKLLDEISAFGSAKEQNGFGARANSPTGHENRVDSMGTLATDSTNLSVNASEKLNMGLRFDSSAYAFFGNMNGDGELLESGECLEEEQDGDEKVQLEDFPPPGEDAVEMDDYDLEDDIDLVTELVQQQVENKPSNTGDKVITGFDSKPSSALTIVSEGAAVNLNSELRINGHPQNRDITDQDMYDRFRDIGIGFE